MRLSVLLSEISDISVKNFFDREISRICIDSRECRRGDLFVAIKGSRYNAEDFFEEVYRCGTRVFLMSEKSEFPDDATIIFSKNPRKTLAELCAKLCGNPEKKMRLIGITGTKGKTTTAVILSKILESAGVKNICVGTLGVLGFKLEKFANTTPDPTILFPLLAAALADGISCGILEVSSQALKDYRVYGIRFDTVVFTGLGYDHIGDVEHRDFTDYMYSKRKLFTDYKATTAVVNSDDAYSDYMSSGVSNVIKCGSSFDSDFRITAFTDSKLGSVFYLSGTKIVSPLPAMYNARNTAIAIAVAKEITGLDISCLSSAVREARVLGRFEYKELLGRNIIVDYAHNRDSFIEISKIARRMFSGRLVGVFGSVGERSFGRRRELAVAAECLFDFTVITEDTVNREPVISVCADIYSHFSDKTLAKIIPTRLEAIKYAINSTKNGDTILLLGKGQEKNIRVEGVLGEFSDSELIDMILLADKSFGRV